MNRVTATLSDLSFQIAAGSSQRRRLHGQVDYFRYKPTMRTERRRGKHNAYFVPYLSRLSTGQRMRT